MVNINNIHLIGKNSAGKWKTIDIKLVACNFSVRFQLVWIESISASKSQTASVSLKRVTVRTRSLEMIAPVIEQCLVNRSFSFCRLCRTSFRALATFYSRKWHPPNRSQCKKLQRSSRLCLKNVSRMKLLEKGKNGENRLKMLYPIEVKIVNSLWESEQSVVQLGFTKNGWA